FFSAKFEEFATVVEILGLDDSRAMLESDEQLILSLDIETEIDVEVRPREIGLSVFSVQNWSEIFRIKVGDLNTFREKYGVDPKYFISRLLNRFDRVVGHNLYEFDALILANWGVDLSGKLMIDTLALSYVVLPEMPSHSLEFLCNVFGIEYEPHESEEDAFASARLLQYLLSIASLKQLDLDVIASTFEPVMGLKGLDVPQTEINYPVERKPVEPDVLVVVPDASRYEVSWYPAIVDAPEPDEVGLGGQARGLAVATICSYSAEGGRDSSALEELANLLMRKGGPYGEYGRALHEEIKSRTRECPVPRDGFAVEHKYLLDILPELQRRFKSVYLKGWMIFGAYGSNPLEVIEELENLADEVVVESPFPPPTSGVKYVRPSRGDKGISFVGKGLDVGNRHVDYLASLLSSLLASRGRKAVLVSNPREKLAAEKVSSHRRVAATVLSPTSVSQLVRRSYQLSGMGYEVIIFSSIGLSARLGPGQEYLLKGLMEASWLAGSGLTVVSSWSEMLEDEYLSEWAQIVEVEPDDEFRPKIPLVAFDSIDEAIVAAEEVVKETWGFTIRPYQRRCISRLLSPYCPGHRMSKPLSIIILPTGSGKSLIFQTVARLLKNRIGGTTIVISPLLALMKDQVTSLRRRGFRVCEISSASPDRSGCLQGLELGTFVIVYMTPEQLRKDDVRRVLERAEINYIVIDEIHTMHKWKNFRPSYSFLASYLKKCREEGFWFPLAGFTATITGEGLQGVIDMLTGSSAFNLDDIGFDADFTGQLDFYEVEVIKGPVLRDNLLLDIRLTGKPRLKELASVVAELVEWADNTSNGKPWIGLIFVSFVRSKRWYENAPTIARYLGKELGEPVIYFHGQLDTERKKEILDLIESVSKGDIKRPRIVVSTKAFGMGVDIPNIRWVVHHMMPESVEDYYQEIGRAGRDGSDAKTVLLYSKNYDFKRRMWLLRIGSIRPEFVLRVYDRLREAAEGSIIPALLLLPRKVLSSKYEKILREISEGLFPEDLENSVERAVAVLNAIGVLDYEIVYKKVATVKSPDDPRPAFKLRGRYVILPREAVSGQAFDLMLEPDGEFSVVRDNGLFGDRRVKCIQVNYLSENVEPGLVKGVVLEEWDRQVISLSLMDRFCNEISKTSSEKRNELARRIVERYLSGSLEELYREMISRREEVLLRVIGRDVLSVYEKMKSGGVTLEISEKEEIIQLFSSLIVLHMVKGGRLPSKLIVGVPYGFKSSLEKGIFNLLNELELPPVTPRVVPVTKEIAKNQGRVREVLSGGEEVLLLITNRTMADFRIECLWALAPEKVHYVEVIR
ncbi:MAG: DEAD/DEAH box helicase, partial [Candidatus Korarchaeota archaeon]|nr:DEAD/DEAH box helicase [Candidatus Korarchaeota archaeon]